MKDRINKLFAVFSVLLVLVLLVSCGKGRTGKDKTKPYDDAESTVEQTNVVTEPETSAAFDSDVSELTEGFAHQTDLISEKYSTTGVQIAVIKGGKLAHTYEYGYSDTETETPVSADSKFRVASLSKLTTDMVFMCLCDEGKVSLDTDISEYLGFTVRNPYYPDVVITPEMLMSHTGTVINSMDFLNSRNNGSSAKLSSLLTSKSSFAKAEPGTYYEYSNFSVATIGAICEKVTGKYFDELAAEYLFEPLGIDASYLASKLKNQNLLAALYGSGGLSVSKQLSVASHPEIGQTHHLVQGNLTISAKDYAKVLSVLCNKGLSDDGKRILSEKSVSEILKSRMMYEENLGTGFGLVENRALLEGKTVYTHTGRNNGMYATFAFDPVTGNGIVVLTSGAQATYNEKLSAYDNCTEYIRLLFPQ